MKIAKPARKKASKQTAAKTAAHKAEANEKEPTTRLNVNMPKSMYRELRIKAAEQETSVSKAVIGLIENYVARG